MIDSASKWLEKAELPVTTDVVTPMDTAGQKGNKTYNNNTLPYCDKSSAMIGNLENETWCSCYPHCQYIIYDGSKFKLHFEALYDSYGIKCKPTSVKNSQANYTGASASSH
jgi:hypothetical protein